MSAQKESTIDWGFLINWGLMNVVGLVIGTTARRLVFGIAFGIVGGGALGKAVEGAVIGAAIGLTQLFSLPPQISRNYGWVAASVIGWALGWSLGWSAGWTFVGGFGTVFAIVGGLSGLIAGAIQWFFLRSQVRQAGWWVLANTLGWSVGLAIGMTVRGILGWPVAGAVSGLITGVVLIWLRQQPTPTPDYQPERASDLSTG